MGQVVKKSKCKTKAFIQLCVPYLWHLPLCSDGVDLCVFPKLQMLQITNNTWLKRLHKNYFCDSDISVRIGSLVLLSVLHEYNYPPFVCIRYCCMCFDLKFKEH